MDLVYSSHAKKRMRERGIEDWEIENAIKFPSYTKRRIDGDAFQTYRKVWDSNIVRIAGIN